MAATLKCTKIMVQRDQQESPTPHKVTAYATDTVVPGVGNVSVFYFNSTLKVENALNLQTDINGAFTLAGLPTVDWTK